MSERICVAEHTTVGCNVFLLLNTLHLPVWPYIAKHSLVGEPAHIAQNKHSLNCLRAAEHDEVRDIFLRC